MKKTTKPTNVDQKIKAVDGSTIDVHSDGNCTGAWLQFPGNDHNLNLVVQKFGNTTLKYVGYRDGHCQADAVAISVDDKGEATIQVVVPGDGDECFRTKEIPLEKLRELIAKHY